MGWNCGGDKKSREKLKQQRFRLDQYDICSLLPFFIAAVASCIIFGATHAPQKAHRGGEPKAVYCAKPFRLEMRDFTVVFPMTHRVTFFLSLSLRIYEVGTRREEHGLWKSETARRDDGWRA